MKLSMQIPALVLVSAFALTGCKKGPALEEMKKIEDACAAKDKEKAIDIALKAAGRAKAFDGTFESVSDKKQPTLRRHHAELKSRTGTACH
jgi:hypothetical protein